MDNQQRIFLESIAPGSTFNDHPLVRVYTVSTVETVAVLLVLLTSRGREDVDMVLSHDESMSSLSLIDGLDVANQDESKR